MVEVWVLLALASAVLAGLGNVFAKKAFKEDHLSPTDIIIVQYTAVLVLTLIIFWSTISFTEFTNTWIYFVAKLIALFTNSVIYYELLKKYTISTVAPLINASPIFLIILSALFLGEVITIIQFLGIIIIIAATYYLEAVIEHHDEKHAHKKHTKKILSSDAGFWITVLALLILLSLTAMFDKLILQQASVGTNLFFTSIIMLGISMFYHEKGHTFIKSLQLVKEKPVAALIGLSSGISLMLIVVAIGMPGVLVSLVIPIRRCSTIVSGIFGGLLFHEKHIEKKFAAIVFMLIGVWLIAL